MTRQSVRSKENFLVFGAPCIEDDEIREVVDSLQSGWLGTGPKVRRFEQAFCRYRNARHAVAVNSCTAALHLSLLVAGVGEGDEVITSAMTFCATVNAIIHSGATPVIADCDPSTQCLTPASIEAKITPRTKALLPVHFAGNACEMEGIMDLARRHDLKVIEDCAHAIETTYRGKPVGTFGDFGCFSFYVTKNLATGEGGLVLTRRAQDADRLKVLALHGMSQDAWHRFSDRGYKHYSVVHPGFKYNMMDLQAALGIHQLRKVETRLLRRRELWVRYQRAFANAPLGLPAEAPDHVRHAHHLYTVMVDPARCGLSRDVFLEAMTAEHIGVGVHYRAIPEHPYYRDIFGWRLEDVPHAGKLGRQTVSLPLSAKLSDGDADDVISAVNKVLAGA